MQIIVLRVYSSHHCHIVGGLLYGNCESVPLTELYHFGSWLDDGNDELAERAIIYLRACASPIYVPLWPLLLLCQLLTPRIR